jgi:hypothetical protein
LSPLEDEKIKNPHHWAYKRILYRKPVPIVHYDKMVRDWHEQQNKELIIQLCRVTGQVAIASALLTRSQHTKNKDRRIKTGRHVMYLFPCDQIPLDIYCRVKPQEGKLIYI